MITTQLLYTLHDIMVPFNKIKNIFKMCDNRTKKSNIYDIMHLFQNQIKRRVRKHENLRFTINNYKERGLRHKYS